MTMVHLYTFVIFLLLIVYFIEGPPSDDSPMETFESQPLIVCTAHIHWDPEFCDVKLIQTMMLMHELRNFVDNAAACFDMVPNGSTGSIKADPNSIPVILCGDLNSLPHSGVVEFLTKGRISVEHADFKELAYRDCLRRLCPVVDKNTNDYTHPFDMVKAYQDDIMPFTNYTYVSYFLWQIYKHRGTKRKTHVVDMTSKASSTTFSARANSCLC